MYFYLFVVSKFKSHNLICKIKRKPLLNRTLQVQCNPYRNKTANECKSTFLSSSFRASITIEAAMVLPLFIFMCIFFMHFFVIYNFQNVMQMNVNNAAKSVGRYSYILDRMSNLSEAEIRKTGIEYDKDLLISGINTGYVWKKILTDEAKSYMEDNVIGGISGVKVFESSLDKNGKGINDIKISYVFDFDILQGSRRIINLSNRCYFRAWVGESINDSEKKKQIVYITKKGNVYHLSKTCSHIKLSVTRVKFSEINSLRNISGGKYYKCSKCVKSVFKPTDIVYISDSGGSYHSINNCSAIKRDIMEIDITEVGSRKLCSRCEKNGG